MAYYVRIDGDAYAFATKKDALCYICRHLRYDHQRGYVYKDRECRVSVCTIEHMGMGIFNYYPKGRLSWDGTTPREVNPKTGEVFNPFAKKR